MYTNLISKNLQFQNLFPILLSVYFILSKQRFLKYTEFRYNKYSILIINY
jgi:hypothetical protein